MAKAEKYYDVGDIQTIDFIEAKFTPEQLQGFLLGNVIKYVSRDGKKINAIDDLVKALDYLCYALVPGYKMQDCYKWIEEGKSPQQ